MTFNQIQYFQKVARLENYHQAAEELYISQPSLSRAIASLETELGVFLFEKKGRGVVLTKAGRLFLEYAERILAECDAATAKMQELATGSGKIDIGYVFPLAGHYIPHKVKKFLELPENKKVVFNFFQNHTSAISKKVKMGELDVGFGGCMEGDEFETFPVVDQEMVIITPKEHPLSERKSIPVTELGNYPIIGYDRDSWMGTHSQFFYKKYNIEPDIIVECPDEYNIVALVKENFGIAFLPKTDILDDEGIVIHSIKDVEIVHQIFMFWMKNRYHLPAVERFIQYMKQQAQEENDSKNALKIYLKDIFN